MELDCEDLPSVASSLTAEDVLSALKALKKGAPGVEGLPYWVFKVYSKELVQVITELFNRSLKESKCPSIFKMALICPIPKGSSNPPEFRPISLLPILSKALERAVRNKWLYPILRGKMDPLQFAFTPNAGLGTDCALTFITHNTLKWLDRPGAVRVLLLDFRKAFDLVLRSRILTEFRIPKEVIYWLFDYLAGRRQCVALSEKRSTWKTISSGVPQGSVLGPLLFAAVIDSLKPKHQNVVFVKYADDLTALICMRRATDDCTEDELSEIIRWAEDKKFQINWDKTLVLDCITTKSFTLNPVRTPAGDVLRNVESARILGVIYSNDLSWNCHVEFIVKRARRCLGIIRQLVKCDCPSDGCWTVYNALLRSVMCYAFPAWCNLPQALFCQLLKIERHVERIIGSNPRCPLLSFCQGNCMRLSSKIKLSSVHPLRCVFLERPADGHGRALRRRSTFLPIFCRTTRLKNSFTRFA